MIKVTKGLIVSLPHLVSFIWAGAASLLFVSSSRTYIATSGCKFSYFLYILVNSLKSLFFSDQKFSYLLQGFLKSCLSAICILCYSSHCTCFIDGWHKYSRETYVGLHIHDSPDYTILLLILWAVALPYKLNEWLVLCICCGLSPSRLLPWATLWSLGFRTGQFRSKRQRCLLPMMSPSSDTPCAGGGVCGRGHLCVLSGYFKRRKRGNVECWRETERMPGVRVVKAKLKDISMKTGLCAYDMCACKLEKKQWIIERMQESGKIQTHALWDSRITNGFSSLRAHH